MNENINSFKECYQNIDDLKKIDFVNKNNRSEDITKLTDFLKFFRKLIHFNISRIESNNSMILDRFLENIYYLRNLKYLCLNHNKIHSEAAKYLSFSLNNLSNLEVLLIRNNLFDDNGIEAISSSFDMLKNLCELDVGFNRISCWKGENLKKLKKLNCLNLDSNLIDDEGISIIANSIQSLTKLNKLNIEKNKITQERLKILIPIMRINTHLNIVF